MAKAGSATIGALRVSLSADTAQFEAGLKSAQSSLAGFAASMKGPLLAVAAGITAAAAGMAAGIKSALNSADDLGKAAQKFGVPVEQLSALKYAADLADVSLETLGTGLGKLSQNMASGEKVFADIGVAIRDANGALRPTEQVFLDVAEVLSKMQDGAAKTALAMKVFGKSGAELIPLLNAGKIGIKQMTDEARELGLVIDGQTAAAAERFNDNLTKLGAVSSGIFIQIAAGVAGPLANFTDKLVEVAKSMHLAETASSLFQSILTSLMPVIISVTAEIQRLTRIFQFFGEVANILSTGEMEGDFARIGEAASRLNTDMKQIAAEVGESLAALSRPKVGGGADISTQIVPGAKKAEAALDGVLIKTKEVKDTIGDFPELIPAGYADLIVQGDRYQEQLKETQQFWSDIGNTIQNQVVSAINDLIRGTFKWKDALASALTAAAGIIGGIGNQSITNAGGWGSILGFAQGGAFKVGGAGGIDSQLVQFMATPGETVTVSHEEAGIGFGFSPVTNIDARGSSMSEAKLKAILDQRDQQWRQALPGAFKQARIQGKV